MFTNFDIDKYLQILSSTEPKSHEKNNVNRDKLTVRHSNMIPDIL